MRSAASLVALVGSMRRQKTAAPPRAAVAARTVCNFTFSHGSRQIRLRPVAFWITVGSLVIMAGWSVASATYLGFRDDVLQALIAQQTEQQYAYEDRIAELRARLDRSTSRQLLDREQLQHKLDDLLRRQAILESRAAALNGLVESTTGSLGALAHRPQPPAANGSPARDHRSSLMPALAPADATQRPSIQHKLARIESSLDRLEQRQSRALAAMQERYEGKARKLRGVLANLGLKLGAAPAAASGGPFVPIKFANDEDGFASALVRVNIAREEAHQLRNAISTIPVRKPVGGDLDISSTFGVRMDPFLRIPALHTGIDFRGEIGDPIHATAAGTVTVAGWSGGYGKMVEIDHGNGLATRYGHLSRIDVAVGERVRAGQIVGHMGSSGRSTGPHLHYETRIDGEAVDPQKFLDAGNRLGAD
jgi:murein DD-endopeptidase MepM/ murein hydrolase activator NlpD